MCNNCVIWCHPLLKRPGCISIAPMHLNGSNGRHECSFSIAYRYMKTRLVVWGSGKCRCGPVSKCSLPSESRNSLVTKTCWLQRHLGAWKPFIIAISNAIRWFMTLVCKWIIPRHSGFRVRACAAILRQVSSQRGRPRDKTWNFFELPNTSIVACRTNQEQWCLQSSKVTLLGLQR